MRISYGFDIEIEIAAPTMIVTNVDIHPDCRGAIVQEQPFYVTPPWDIETYHDMFGNICRRIRASPGAVTFRAAGLVDDSGAPDPVIPNAMAIDVGDLPVDTLQFLAGSRYCETDLLSAFAWSALGSVEGGWAKVQAICDFVHQHISFGYQHARATRTAFGAFEERVGVCRDFAHLAVTLCRCLNIPARYCNGYLGDIGVPRDPAPMDFNAWFEVFLSDPTMSRPSGRWYIFDARHNIPRIGRITIARGRDATDIPMLNSFGPHTLRRFVVVTEQA